MNFTMVFTDISIWEGGRERQRGAALLLGHGSVQRMLPKVLQHTKYITEI